MRLRILQRVASAGTLKLPAVPGLVDAYLKVSAAVFSASGRGLYAHEQAAAREVVLAKLQEAFAASPRSRVALTFEAEPGRALGFSVEPDVTTLAQAYERWIGNTEGPLFGAHPDARVLEAAQSEACANRPVLDFGAGTGRNALGLARLGFTVDAVEITPRFAEVLKETAECEKLPVRVIAEDVFQNRTNLRRDYGLLFASEVVPDFRGVTELRQLFELAAAVLAPGGTLLFNVHLAAPGYNPEKAARELSQQCYSCLFTQAEILTAAKDLPFRLKRNDSVLDFEKAHLPASSWPPTPWYENWISGLDVYEIEVEKCPVELRWLQFERTLPDALVTPTPEVHLTIRSDRAKRKDPAALRQAIEKRYSRRLSASGTLVLPAVPRMRATYSAMLGALFQALGRQVDDVQKAQLTNHLETALTQAFERSQRSNVVVTYEAPIGSSIKYTVTPDPATLSEAYVDWYESLGSQTFGEHADAKVLALAARVRGAKAPQVLDLGAGLGRNSLALSRQGFSVTAVEWVPRFVEVLRAQAQSEKLTLRVLEGDALSCELLEPSAYGLVIASGLAADLRRVDPLRKLFEQATRSLLEGGHLVISLHLTPDASAFADLEGARQWAQQSSAMFFTREELGAALEGLPLEPLEDEDAHDFERAHLPEHQFPVTEAYPEWATGRHLFAVAEGQSPVTLRWLVFRRRGDG